MILVYGDSKYHIIVRMLISHHIWPLTSIKPVVTGGFKHSEYAGPPHSTTFSPSLVVRLITVAARPTLSHKRTFWLHLIWNIHVFGKHVKLLLHKVMDTRYFNLSNYPHLLHTGHASSSRLCLWQIHFRYAKFCFSSFPASQLWFRAFCAVWV